VQEAGHPQEIERTEEEEREAACEFCEIGENCDFTSPRKRLAEFEVAFTNPQFQRNTSLTITESDVTAVNCQSERRERGTVFRRPDSIRDWGCAGSSQSAVHSHHVCVKRLGRAELWVIAGMRNRSASTVDQIDEKLVRFHFLNGAVDRNLHDSCFRAQGSRAIGRKNCQNL
jgi:hypothetical protein